MNFNVGDPSHFSYSTSSSSSSSEDNNKDGSNNDNNVLEASHIFSNLAEGIAPPDWDVFEKYVLHDMMTACIIMHNMIIEDERDVDAAIEDHLEVPTLQVETVIDENTRFQEFLTRHR
ncbi:hypothetical protein Ddye_030137 [Dipteronia dyeriana]|uniref:Uncharacterized protein n=1 Tax=Dipteronia dyeriana TaxID=168575 RepID=A0AAD9TFR4_9ROSI|nr:hypothetical protein Ddye_030137 [Dipteronia dyeriana]